MAPAQPFMDPNTGGLDIDSLLYETKPIALLLLVFGGIGAFLLLLAEGVYPGSILYRLFSLAAEFAFTLGGFVTALYVLVRALQFTGNFDGLPTADADSPGGADSEFEIPVRDRSSGRVSRARTDMSADETDREDENEMEPEPGTEDGSETRADEIEGRSDDTDTEDEDETDEGQ